MSEREHIDPATAAREQTIPWQDLIASVFRHRRVVLTLLLTGIALGLAGSWLAVGRHLSAIEPT